MRKGININIERKIYAESMGRCMNPACKVELFKDSGDIMEKAHIIPHCKTADNSFENLIILCPNCHTNFDKNNAFSTEEVKEWKKIRGNEFKNFFSEEYDNFEELKNKIVPLLLENQAIFEHYYLEDKRILWDSAEGRILSNNRIIKEILQKNTRLIQNHNVEAFSNLTIVQRFLLHIDEFEATRLSEEKVRSVVFPVEINSLFSIKPLEDKFLPSVESVESLIMSLQNRGEFESIILGEDKPYISIKTDKKYEKIYLDDIPKLRQMYYDNNSFRGVKVRFESLNYALKIIKSKGLKFEFRDINNLKEIIVKNVNIVFIYEYCLSKVTLLQLAPPEECVILNLHHWNGVSCISAEAYELAKDMNIKLLTMDKFYGYVNSLKYER